MTREHRLGNTNCSVPADTARLLCTHRDPTTQRVNRSVARSCYRCSCPTTAWCPHTDCVSRGNGLPCPERSTVFLCAVLPSKSSIVYLPLSCGVGSLICNQICSPVTPVFTRSVNLIWVSLKNTQYYVFISLEYKWGLLMKSHWVCLQLLNDFQGTIVCHHILKLLKSNSDKAVGQQGRTDMTVFPCSRSSSPQSLQQGYAS